MDIKLSSKGYLFKAGLFHYPVMGFVGPQSLLPGNVSVAFLMEAANGKAASDGAIAGGVPMLDLWLIFLKRPFIVPRIISSSTMVRSCRLPAPGGYR